MNHYLFRSVLLLMLTSLSLGCSLRQMALRETAAIMAQAMPAFEKDWNIDFVETALPGSIKLMEGLLESDKGNADLLFMLAQAYTAYAFVFVEDRLGQAETEAREDEAAALNRKGREMYMRGYRYGLRLLEQRRPGLRAALKQGGQALDQALKACDAEDLRGLFWTGMPLAGAVNLARDDVEMIAFMPKARALVGRVLELDERYYHAGPHMIYGALFGSVGTMLGGDPEKGRQHFEKALSLTGRRFLMVQVMYARTAAVQLQDRALFEKLLGEVMAADLSIFPEQKLANAAAKRRARRLLAQAGELF